MSNKIHNVKRANLEVGQAKIWCCLCFEKLSLYHPSEDDLAYAIFDRWQHVAEHDWKSDLVWHEKIGKKGDYYKMCEVRIIVIIGV